MVRFAKKMLVMCVLGAYDPIFGIILVGTLALIASEKVHKLKASALGAGLTILFATLPNSGPNGGVLIGHVSDLLELVEPDLLLIIVGMTMLIGVSAPTGIFEFFALKILKRSGGKPRNLLLYLSALTMISAAFLDAYMAIILFGSITLISVDGLVHEDGSPLDPKPYLIAEAMFGNIGGMLTRVASPPNIILGGHFDISFVQFFVVMFTPTVLGAVGALATLAWVFRKELAKPVARESVGKLMAIDENSVVRDWRQFWIAGTLIVLTVIGFILTSVVNMFGVKMELGYVAMAGGFAAVALLSGTHHATEEAMKKVEWSIVFFFACLLLIVGAAEKLHLLNFVAKPFQELLSIDLSLGYFSIIMGNAITSSLLDNVPMAAVMTGVIDEIVLETGMEPYPLVWAAVIGTNMGGNLTPIGSASTVQAVELLNRRGKGKKVGFVEFFKIGIMVSIIPILVGTLYVVSPLPQILFELTQGL